MVFKVCQAVDLPGMTGKTVSVDPSFKSQVVGRPVARCQVPDAFFYVPGERRLKQQGSTLKQVRPSPGS